MEDVAVTGRGASSVSAGAIFPLELAKRQEAARDVGIWGQSCLGCVYCCFIGMADKKSAAMKRCEGYMKAVRKGKKKTASKKKK